MDVSFRVVAVPIDGLNLVRIEKYSIVTDYFEREDPMPWSQLRPKYVANPKLEEIEAALEKGKTVDIGIECREIETS